MARDTGAGAASPPEALGPTLSPPLFEDRADAGRRLAQLLARFRDRRPVIVGMARGGVPVAAEVARALQAPLDVAVVSKIGAPQHGEYAIGAVAEGGVLVLNDEERSARELSPGDAKALERVQDALARQGRLYRQDHPPRRLKGRVAILVDDGLATGRSARAAIQSLRVRGAARVVLAVPVAARQSAQALEGAADEIVAVAQPENLWAVGLWYEDFRPVRDEEVIAALDAAPAGGNAHGQERAPPSERVAIDVGLEQPLRGELCVPAHAHAIVLFAHGSGSSRLSPRNRVVATAMNEAGYATLLFDLLTRREEVERANVFDIELLADRLIGASKWLSQLSQCGQLALAYFGASTGAAAALDAAAALADRVSAVVSRGGRPDLAHHLREVRAPTLLIVGGADRQVLELNRRAQRQLRAHSELAVVPDATHLFEEPGALEQVTRLAVDWLDRHLAAAARADQPPARAHAR